MQKFSLTMSLLVIVLITFLFSILFETLEYQLETEKERARRVLNLSVALAVNYIQDEVEFTYRELARICKETIDEGIVDEDEILQRIDEKPLSGRYVDSLLGIRTVFRLENDFPRQLLTDHNNYYPFYQYFGEFEENEFAEMIFIYQFLDGFKEDEIREMIFIDNFSGVMIFPLGLKGENEVSRFLIYKLNLTDIVRDFLPQLVKKIMIDSPDVIEANLSTFTSRIVYGYELNKNNRPEEMDLIVDLNRIFNMNTVFDYHLSRQERDFIHFDNIANLIDNHLYLSLQHESGSISLFFRKRVLSYLAGIVLLYLVTISAVIALLYTTYRVRRSVIREKEFTAMVSHELKTPLSVIKLGADNLAEGFVKDQKAVVDYGLMIKSETKKLGSMIDNILSISSVMNTKANSLFASHSIKSIAENVEEQCFGLMESRKVKLEIHFLGKHESVYCNRPTFTGALCNIVRNSIIYGASRSKDRTVYLYFSDEIYKSREGLLVRISNNGPVINKRESRKIFTPFYRGKAVRDGQISGTGLGLAISCKIVKEHKGKIYLDKTFRKGTAFQVWIPYRTIK